MVFNNYNIQNYRSKLKETKSREAFYSTLLDIMTDTDWNNISMNDEFELLLLEIKSNKFFDEKSFKIMLKNFPNINNLIYHHKIISGFFVSLMTSDYVSEDDLIVIYNKFGKSVSICKALATNSITPTEILEKLAFHEQYSVVAEIANNTGKSALELLKNPEMAQRVLFAQLLLNGYTSHLYN